MPYGLGDDALTHAVIANGTARAAKASKAEQDRAEAKAAKKAGIPRNAELKVKGLQATVDQIDAMNEVLRTAESKAVAKELGKYMERCVEALVVGNIGESSYNRHARNPSSGAYGIYQTLGSWMKDAQNVPKLTRIFLGVGGFHGFAKYGGALQLAKANPSMSAGDIASHVEGADQGGHFYQPYLAEARAIIEAFGGIFTNCFSDKSSGYETVAKAFMFSRPYPATANPYQDSWECSNALADEVEWRLFAMADRVYYFSEPRLAAQEPVIISRTRPDLAEYLGKVRVTRNNSPDAATAEVEILCDPMFFHSGECVLLEGFGGGKNDRWIVEHSRRSVYSQYTTLNLKKAKYPQPEPAHDVAVAENGSASTSDGTASGPLRSRIVAEAQKTLTSSTHFSYYSQPGAMTDDPTPGVGKRSDCSQWVRAIYLKAGADNPGANTAEQAANGKRTAKPKPGDLMMTASTGHVELYVGDGKTIGHGSPPIDYANVDDFPGHYFITFDFLDRGEDGAAGYSKGSGPD